LKAAELTSQVAAGRYLL